ncbi:heat shock protein 60A-like [Rhodnius prolixus]|uniref:Putative 60 kDa heat shock protein n=1 Tax=Rhodnius prolixus TaxID=13249 RepID=R4G3F5_RHOPR
MRAIFPSKFYKELIKQTGIRNYAKEIKFGNEGKTLLLKGAETVANVVSVTIGPKAGSVIVDGMIPKITKDGSLLANSIALTDQYENVGAQILKKLADATQKQVNNCTKMATILAMEIARQGYKFIIKGSNPVQIRKGILDGAEVGCKYLDSISKKIVTSDDIAKVATIFAEGDEKLGEVIGEAITLVGKDGVITVKESDVAYDTTHLSRGIIFQSGVFNCNFPADKDGKLKLVNALLLICTQKIENFKTLVPVLELAVAKHKPLVIMAEDFSPNVTITFALNNEAVIGIKCVTVKMPSDKDFDKDILLDLAYSFGGKVYGDISCGKKRHQIDESYFGVVPEIILTKTEMTCLHGNSKLVLDQIEEINKELESCRDVDTRIRLKDRLSRMESNIAIISIDGNDQEKAKKKKELIYSAIESTKVAMEEGLVPGGGMALIRCQDAINQIDSMTDDHKLGIKILTNSLAAPFNKILKNSHDNPALILHKLRSLPHKIGFDVNSHDLVDVYEMGIVDQTKAVKLALRNATNTASLMINAEAVVVYKFDGTEIVT